MRLSRIPVIVTVIYIILNASYFLWYSLSFDYKYLETWGGILVIGGIIELLILLISIVILIYTKATRIKRNLKIGIYSVIIGFLIIVFFSFKAKGLNKYSRLKIQNNTDVIIKNFIIFSTSNKNVKKHINKINSGKSKTIYINKYDNHKWKIEYYFRNDSKSDSVEYLRYFYAALNDKIIINPDGTIDKHIEETDR